MVQVVLWILFFGVSFSYIFLANRSCHSGERFKAMYIEDHFEIELSEELGYRS